MVAGLILAQLALLGAEIWALLALRHTLLLFLPIHFLLSVGFAAAFAFSLAAPHPARSGGRIPWTPPYEIVAWRGPILLSALLAILIPVVGMGCAFLIACLLLGKPLPAGDLLEEFKEHTTLPHVQGVTPKEAPGKELLTMQRSVEPLVDMLATPDPQMKRAVLDAIARRRDPKLIPHVLAALQDPRPEIYQFAMAKVIKLQEEFGSEIAKATAAVSAEPDRVDPHHRLAEVYNRYLKSGLVDQAVAGFYREQLREEYGKILTLAPGNFTVLVAVGRLSLETGRMDEAQQAFEEALGLSPLHLEARLGLAEALYLRGRYREMAREIRTAVEGCVEEGSDPALLELAEWWLSREEVPA